jgi:hypothetical protein
MSAGRFVLIIAGLLAATLLAVVFFVSATALVYAIGLGEARVIRIYTGLTAGSALVAMAGFVWLRNRLRAQAEAERRDGHEPQA